MGQGKTPERAIVIAWAFKRSRLMQVNACRAAQTTMKSCRRDIGIKPDVAANRDHASGQRRPMLGRTS
jgi:hypothetical protein